MRSLNERAAPALSALSHRRGVSATLRLSRRLARLAERAGHLPRPSFGLVAGVFLASTAAYGIGVGGRGTQIVDGVAVPLGFSIDQIDVTGNDETSDIDVLQAIWQTGSQSLFTLDPTTARQSIEDMAWIDRASVTKIFPDRVKITLSEHRPYAVWQKADASFVVVNREGKEIVPYTPGRFSKLPLVVGEGAAEDAAGLIDDMESLPELRARVKAYVRVAGRRWDLTMDNGVTIQLPEDDPIDALAEVARLDREEALLSRDITLVDMRLPDRIVVKLTADAFERRKEALKERAKIAKASDKDKPV